MAEMEPVTEDIFEEKKACKSLSLNKRNLIAESAPKF
jgi:hypothetical protein